MELSRQFNYVKFRQEAIRLALTTVESFAKRSGSHKVASQSCTVGSEAWQLDNLEEFFDLYGNAYSSHLYYIYETKEGDSGLSLSVSTDRYGTSVTAKSPRKSEIVAVMNVFEQQRSAAIDLTPKQNAEESSSVAEMNPDDFRIFIGHGHSRDWIDLKNHLVDKHGYHVEAFETGERAGHAIRDILEDMLDRSDLAFLVFTGEDDTADGGTRARQNVVHETGLFQGRLGFSRAIILLEEGVEGFSNVHGIQYIPFERGGIRSTFGDVLAVIRRETLLEDRRSSRS